MKSFAAPITLKADIAIAPHDEAVLKHAMWCATRVYNGVIWELRGEYRRTGETTLTRSHVRQLVKAHPRYTELQVCA